MVAEWFVNGYPLQASKFVQNFVVNLKVFNYCLLFIILRF